MGSMVPLSGHKRNLLFSDWFSKAVESFLRREETVEALLWVRCRVGAKGSAGHPVVCG